MFDRLHLMLVIALIRTHARMLSVCAALALAALVVFGAPAANAATVRKVVVTRNVVYTGVAPAAVKLDVWKSVGVARAPVLVLLHGGGWARSGRAEWDMNGWTGWFARAGFVVVNADYRLACRSPLAPAAPASRSLIPVKADPTLCNANMAGALADADAAVAWTIAHARAYGGDPRRIVLMGGSAGAHLALLVGSQPNRPAALRGVVAFSPPADLEWFAHTGIKLARGITTAIGCDFATCPSEWRRYSPLRTVGAGGPPVPTYVMRSRHDFTTPWAQVQRYAGAALRAGTPLTLREPKETATACHGPWSCERHGVLGTSRSLRADVTAWIHVKALQGGGKY
ncbi:MAG: hypothetical protein JWN41_26 [Thermoleophilia bacterium]|nr:hypothetical protein [Thermoleophilia bacterium]